MKKIIFNDKYRLTQAVLEGRKTQTRRVAYNGEVPNLIKGYGYEGHICGSAAIFNGEYMIAKSRYNVYDVVAVAQSYQDVLGITHVEDLQLRDALIRSKGYTNKMFVRADLMPHCIRITNIRIERLQDISEEDCLAEGIVDFESRINKAHFTASQMNLPPMGQPKNHTPCSLTRSQEKAHGSATPTSSSTSSN